MNIAGKNKNKSLSKAISMDTNSQGEQVVSSFNSLDYIHWIK